MTVEDLSFILRYLDPEKPIYMAYNPVKKKLTEVKNVFIIDDTYIISPDEIE